MEFTVDKNKFQKVLDTLNGTFGSADFPAMNCIYINVDANGDGYARSSNGIASTTVKFQAQATADFEGLIDGYTLIPIMKTFADGDVKMEIPNGSFMAEVTHKKGSLTINGMDPMNFPDLQSFTEESSFMIPANDFKQALKTVEVSRLKNTNGASDIKLGGIGLFIDSEKATLACSDRTRISKFSFDAKHAQDMNIVLAPETIKGLSAVSGNIAVRLSSKSILLETVDVMYQGPIIDEKFPNVTRFFGNYDQAAVANLPTNEIESVLKRISIMAAGANKQKKSAIPDATFTLDQGEFLTIDYASASGKISETISMNNYNGEDLTIKLNVDLLLQGLKYVETENVEIRVLEDNKPVVLHPEGNREYSFFAAAIS